MKAEQTGLCLRSQGKNQAFCLKSCLQTLPAISHSRVCCGGTLLLDKASAGESLLLLPCPEIPHSGCTCVGCFSLNPFNPELPWLEFHPRALPTTDKMPETNKGLCISLWMGPEVQFSGALLCGRWGWLKMEFGLCLLSSVAEVVMSPWPELELRAVGALPPLGLNQPLHCSCEHQNPTQTPTKALWHSVTAPGAARQGHKCIYVCWLFPGLQTSSSLL